MQTLNSDTKIDRGQILDHGSVINADRLLHHRIFKTHSPSYETATALSASTVPWSHSCLGNSCAVANLEFLHILSPKVIRSRLLNLYPYGVIYGSEMYCRIEHIIVHLQSDGTLYIVLNSQGLEKTIVNQIRGHLSDMRQAGLPVRSKQFYRGTYQISRTLMRALLLAPN